MRLPGALCAAGLLLALVLPALAAAPKDAVYVGSEACADCHQTEYENYHKFAKKAHSSQSIKIMAPKLSAEDLKTCFACHTTGYGKPGGFKSFEQTPKLANAGCEVCHGPGSAHCESGDPKQIIAKLSIKDCEFCHNEERVGSFNFKPMLFGGAH